MRSYWPFLLVSLFSSAAANLLMRGAMSKISAHDASSIFLQAAGSPPLWLGLVLWGAGFLLWLRVLATEEISRVYPVVVGLSFLVVGVGSKVLFRESIPTGALAGSVLVVVGIALASGDSHPRSAP